MDVSFTPGAGLDVHKKSVAACRITPDSTGQQADGLVGLKDFRTMTVDLMAFPDRGTEAGITRVAMESSGEYWKPVFNVKATCRSSW
jgi:transposase